jgi:hypothetical protein
MEQVGAVIVDILERAGTRYLKQNEPDLYRAYLLNIGATNTVRRYDETAAYWDRVQLILDGFFSSNERAQICTEVIARRELWERPEFRGFLRQCIAERRLQSMIATATLAPHIRLDARSAAARRVR